MSYYSKEELEMYGPIWEKDYIYHIGDTLFDADYYVLVTDITNGIDPVKTVTVKGKRPDILFTDYPLEMDMTNIDTITKIGHKRDFPEYIL